MAVLNFWGLAMGIKVDTYNSALRVSHLCAIAALAFLAYLHPSSAHAQVAIEGTYSYSISQSGSQLSTKGTVAKLTNYNFSDYTGVRALIVLSKRSYSSGGTTRGETIAQSSVGSFPARTFFTNIPLRGSSRLPAKGTYRILFLVVDRTNRILVGLTAPKRLKVNRIISSFGVVAATAPSATSSVNSGKALIQGSWPKE